ncbi:unnamed protein product [Prunus brigantina]
MTNLSSPWLCLTKKTRTAVVVVVHMKAVPRMLTGIGILGSKLSTPGTTCADLRRETCNDFYRKPNREDFQA